VLGHEIAHVAARHASRQALRAQFSQVGLLAGAILGQQVLGTPGVAENILQLGGAGLQLLLTKYSRDAEREADDLGVRYAAQEGYLVSEAAGFFRVLERKAEEAGAIPSWQSTHPDPGERAETIIQMSRELAPPGNVAVVGQEEFYNHLEGIVVGEDPRQGYTDDGSFFHPELAFRFDVPSGWQLNNQRAAVVMAPEDRSALLGLTLTQAETPRQAADELAGTEGLEVVDRRSTTVSGLEAHRILAIAQSQQGRVALLNYFIAYDGKVYSFLGYAPEQRFQAYQDVMASTIRSFSELTDSDRLSVQPTRLEIVPAPRRAPFAELVRTPLPEGFTVEELSVMNQVQVSETIAEGQPLKLLR
jgi:predicted Zn-dependent protease